MPEARNKSGAQPIIAVDGMGGDFAPHAIVEGVVQAAQSGVSVLLFGTEKRLKKMLSSIEKNWEKLPIQLIGTTEIIGMAEEPVLAVRKKPLSSLVQAVNAVKSGEARAVLSAGNSGALMTAAFFLLGREPGVERPAIAGILPTRKGDVVVLDLGANVDCKPHYLEQFAQMGVQYAENNLGITDPRVGILSNGAERGKGSMLVKQAGLLLEDSPLNFIGNVEPTHIMKHHVDVVVCDGFSGNILLKTTEAATHLAIERAAHAASQGGVGRSAQAGREEQMLHAMGEPLKRAEQGGARLLGVSGTVVVLHGNSDAEHVAGALKVLSEEVSRK